MKIKYKQGMTLSVTIEGGNVFCVRDANQDLIFKQPANKRGVRYVKEYFKRNYHVPTKESVIDFPWLV
jgi:hypothetical protein